MTNKLKGLTKCCPACKKILFRHANIKGEGNFQIKCIHCSELIQVDITQETRMTTQHIAKALMIIFLIFGIYGIITISKGKESFVIHSELDAQ